ncbi:MAG: bifunctional 5,10-methylenetetrahydrofolate dehydrogenase/5,10-methenyltetrahydrofolate cyclohydrolase [Patescibacteria group bacterium]
MIIDGKKIAEEIKDSLKKEIDASKKKLKLAIVQVGENEVSKKFIEQKQKFAEEIGVKTKIYNLPVDISTNKLRKKMAGINKLNDGVIIQLPLPEQVNTQYILNSIPAQKDVDVLSENRSKCLTPVVGAIKEIFERNKIDVRGKDIVVIGRGILVGRPAAIWLISQSATVSVLTSQTKNPEFYTRNADIIISGVGKPNLITPDMVKDGVIILDAGTPGDVDPAVAGKASIFTPVPGGIGPLTVAMIFKNLLELQKHQKSL